MQSNNRDVFAFVAATTAVLTLSGSALAAATPMYNKDSRWAPQSQRTPMENMFDDVREMRALRGENQERTFLEKMMDHHQSGVDMARLALERGSDPQIQAEARQIITEQNREIAMLRAHLHDAHGIDRTAKPDPRMHETMQNLALLSGSAFDRAFAREMAHHHEMAILMSRPVRLYSPHSETRQIAAVIVQGNRTSQRDLRVALR